jgi:hypothetical protein
MKKYVNLELDLKKFELSWYQVAADIRGTYYLLVQNIKDNLTTLQLEYQVTMDPLTLFTEPILTSDQDYKIIGIDYRNHVISVQHDKLCSDPISELLNKVAPTVAYKLLHRLQDIDNLVYQTIQTAPLSAGQKELATSKNLLTLLTKLENITKKVRTAEALLCSWGPEGLLDLSDFMQIHNLFGNTLFIDPELNQQKTKWTLQDIVSTWPHGLITQLDTYLQGLSDTFTSIKA